MIMPMFSRIDKPIFNIFFIINMSIGKSIDPTSGSGDLATGGVAEAIQEGEREMKNSLVYLIEIARKFNI
jgi:hypothetical protein